MLFGERQSDKLGLRPTLHFSERLGKLANILHFSTRKHAFLDRQLADLGDPQRISDALRTKHDVFERCVGNIHANARHGEIIRGRQSRSDRTERLHTNSIRHVSVRIRRYTHEVWARSLETRTGRERFVGMQERERTVVACSEYHALAFETADDPRFEVEDERTLPSDEHLRVVEELANARDDLARHLFAHVDRETQELVGVFDDRHGDDGAKCDVEFRKIFVRNERFHIFMRYVFW